MSEKPLSTDPQAGIAAPAPATPLGAHPEAKMSAAAPQIAPGFPGAVAPESVDALGNRKAVSPAVERFMTTPLARPTGVDAIDEFLSPASLAMMAPSAVSAVKGAVTGLADSLGAPLAKKVLKFVTPSMLKKPAEFVGLLSDIADAVKGKAETPPVAPQAPAPAAAAAAPKTAMQAALDEFLAKAEARRAAQAPAGATPAAAAPVPPTPAPTAAPEAPVPAATASQPAAAPPTTPMKLGDRLNLFMRESRKAGVTLSADDVLALNKVVTAGTDPTDAVRAMVAEKLAGTNPAAAFNARYGLPTPTEAQTRFPKGMRGKATGAQE